MPKADAPVADKQGADLMDLNDPLLQIGEEEGFVLESEQVADALMPGEGQQPAQGGNQQDVMALMQQQAQGQPAQPEVDPLAPNVVQSESVKQQLAQLGFTGTLPDLVNSQKEGHAHVTQLSQDNALLRQQMVQQQQQFTLMNNQMNQMLQNQQQQQQKGLSDEELNSQWSDNPAGAMDYKLNQFADRMQNEFDSRLSKGLEGQSAFNQMINEFPDLQRPSTPLGTYGPQVLNMMKNLPPVIQTLALQGLNSTVNDPNRMLQDYQEGRNVGKQEALQRRNAMTEQPSSVQFNQQDDTALATMFKQYGQGSGLTFDQYKKLYGNKQKEQAQQMAQILGRL